MISPSAILSHVVHVAHPAPERCSRFITSGHRTWRLGSLSVLLVILSVVVFGAIAVCPMWIVASRNGRQNDKDGG